MAAVLLVVSVAAVVAVVGCGGAGGGGDGGDGGGGGSAAPATSTVAVGLLGFRAPVVGSGGELDGSTLAGKPVALWFWAPT